jgi:hypothetical protein
MSQPASDLPRFVQTISRYRALIGFMAIVGLLSGVLFAALNPPVFTSRALVLLPAPAPSSCPVGAICGGPAFPAAQAASLCPAGSICGGPAFPSYSTGPRHVSVTLLQTLPAGVQVAPEAGNVLRVTATGRTAAQAEAAADAAALQYSSSAGSLQGGLAAAPLLVPATSATGPAPLLRLRDDALLGAAAGALLGLIAALAAGWTTIDTLPAPPTAGFGEADGGPEAASAGIPLEQMAQEYLRRKAIPDLPNDRSQAGPA